MAALACAPVGCQHNASPRPSHPIKCHLASPSQVFLALLGRPSVEGQAALQLPRPEPVAEVEALVEQLRQVHSL